jgi:hypothetical protein
MLVTIGPTMEETVAVISGVGWLMIEERVAVTSLIEDSSVAVRSLMLDSIELTRDSMLVTIGPTMSVVPVAAAVVVVTGTTTVVESITLVTRVVVVVDELKFCLIPVSTNGVAVTPALTSLRSWQPPPVLRRKLKAMHPGVELQMAVHSRIELPEAVPIRFEFCLFRDTGPMLKAWSQATMKPLVLPAEQLGEGEAVVVAAVVVASIVVESRVVVTVTGITTVVESITLVTRVVVVRIGTTIVVLSETVVRVMGSAPVAVVVEVRRRVVDVHFLVLNTVLVAYLVLVVYFVLG